MTTLVSIPSPKPRSHIDAHKIHTSLHLHASKSNQVGTVLLYGVPIVSLVIENQERLCLAQISNTLLKEFSYNEIHNRRVALGITCVQCTPVQLEILRRAGAMPVSSRRCGMITRREAERLCKSFLGDNSPPKLPDDFAFSVHHECAWGCRGAFLPSRYNSSRAKCIKCTICGLFFSPNKFIFHSHRTGPAAKYVQPDAANFNSWRRHMRLSGNPPMEVVHAWEDVKAMFNGGTRKRLLASASSHSRSPPSKPPEGTDPPMPPSPTRVPPLPLVMDYVWHKHSLAPYPLPWLGLPPAPPLLMPQDGKLYPSAFRPVSNVGRGPDAEDEPVDIETCPEDEVKRGWTPASPRAGSIERNPDSPGSDPEVDVGSETNDAVVAEGPVEVPKLGQGVGETPLNPPIWSVARLQREWPDRSFYARHLSLMRELVGPSCFQDSHGPLIPFLPLHSTVDQHHSRKFKDKMECSSKLDCSTCHQMTGPYSPTHPLALAHASSTPN